MRVSGHIAGESLHKYGKRVDFLLLKRIMATVDCLSKKDLAKKAGMSEDTVRKMCSDEPWNFTPRSVRKVATALGLETPGELLRPLLDREIGYLQRRGLLSEEEIGSDSFRR